MTYSSLMVKLLASIIVVLSILLLPQPVSSDNVVFPTVEKPAEKVAVTQTPVHLTKKITTKNIIKGDCTKYSDIIKQYDWPVAIAMQICKDESSGDPSNINWNDAHYDSKGNLICMSSRGLMQISCEWPVSLGYTLTDLVDPVKNIEIAYQIYLKNGFYPWTTYKIK